tara:strand:- start:347 stop:508 length:162 start_codon:yes stop_codon:yes gene_type:complete
MLKMTLAYKLATTDEAGLLAIGQMMDSIQLAKRVDKHLSAPKSNRSFMLLNYI